MAFHSVATTQGALAGKQRSQLSIIGGQLWRNRGAMIGLTLILIEILAAIFAPVVSPYDPIDGDLMAALQPPSTAHLLGTDELGRDLLSRLIYGARISLRIGLIAVAIAGSIGVTLGMVAGFYGGRLGEVIIARG